MKREKYNINIITLGCSKNLVDSETLMKQFDANHFNVSHNGDIDSSDTILINTCGFINDAKEESINTILDCIDAKNEGLVKSVYVFGCLSQRYRDELLNEMPEVDGFFGVDSFKEILSELSGQFKKELIGERILTTPKHFAYLKIAEGCNWGCSYCAIPLIRGKFVSVPIEELVEQAKKLVQLGVKEILLIAQDLTYYGLDIYNKRELARLLENLAQIEGLEWIKLHYAYPAHFPMDVLDVMNKYSNICKYLDIPFQHINTGVLQNMRRGITSDETKELINKIKEEVPGITLRTTLLVGHPGETEDAFNELLEFVKETKFDRLGVFTYSEEEDTWGAKNFDDSIPQEVKQERADLIMEMQQDISLNKNQEKIGKEFKVVIDRIEDGHFIGRTEYDSPEVDNEVLIKADSDLQIGNFYTVTITDADHFDLHAELV